jgi:hypothetical protein
MNNSFCQLLNNVDDRMPTDGGNGGRRRMPTDGGNGGRRRMPTDGGNGGR